MNSKYTDDAFVVTSTFDELRDSGYGRSERIARALSRAGAAVSLFFVLYFVVLCDKSNINILSSLIQR